jgi:hypothetical protein
MTKAKAITRVHTRSEQEKMIRLPDSRRYVRANSPTLVHGFQGTRSENIRGQYSSPNFKDAMTDPGERARAFGRRNKATATVASLKKA